MNSISLDTIHTSGKWQVFFTVVLKVKGGVFGCCVLCFEKMDKLQSKAGVEEMNLCAEEREFMPRSWGRRNQKFREVRSFSKYATSVWL